MLPNGHRLKTKKDFDYVYKTGRRIKSPYFIIIATHQDASKLPTGYTLPRFGIIASKKVGKAVERNKAKRRIREIVRKHFAELETDFDAVIISSPILNNARFADIENALIDSFQKLKLLK